MKYKLLLKNIKIKENSCTCSQCFKLVFGIYKLFVKSIIIEMLATRNKAVKRLRMFKRF